MVNELVIMPEIAIWQLTTGYWRLFFKELSRLALGAAAEDATTPSSHFGDTAPGLAYASAHVTLAGDEQAQSIRRQPHACVPPLLVSTCHEF